MIEINNSTTIRAVPSWQYSCEWNIEVKPGRTIEVTFLQLSIQQGPSGTCTNNYLMVNLVMEYLISQNNLRQPHNSTWKFLTAEEWW